MKIIIFGKIKDIKLYNMKIEEFEKLILSLKKEIHIDEFVINKGKVKHVYGHTKNTFIKWDEDGSASIAPCGLSLDLKMQFVDTKNLVRRWCESSMFNIKPLINKQ